VVDTFDGGELMAILGTEVAVNVKSHHISNRLLKMYKVEPNLLLARRIHGVYLANEGLTFPEIIKSYGPIQALRRNKGNKTAVAKQLGIHKSTLFHKMTAFDITPELYAN
jgi:transcriptional regulator with PAS, ATPase and Fis domain